MTADRAGRTALWPRASDLRIAWVAGTVLAAAVLFSCYLWQSRTVPAGSDGASQALQAWDLLHGNPLLHGWWLTDVSFYTTELPQYALIEFARGLTPDVPHIGGAMTYTLLVVAAAFLARGGAPGAAGLARALIAAALLLAPQLGDGTQTLLLSPDHTGTGVPLLLSFLVIDRSLVTAPAGPPVFTGRPGRWLVPLLVFLALGAALVADAMTLFVAIIPIALVTAIRAAIQTARGGARRRELSVGLAAVLAYPAGLAAIALLQAAGGWQVNGLRTALAPAARLGQNARLTGEGLLELFGANVFGPATWPDTAFAAAHLASVLAAGLGVVIAVRGFFRPDGFIPAVLLGAIVIDLAGYLGGVQAVNLLSTREIAPVLPFAAVLAGRALGDRLALEWRHRRGAAAVAGITLLLYAAALGHAAAQPPAAPQAAGLTAWLRAHHFTHGLSGYHEASIVTLEGGGAVTVRPVAPVPGARPGSGATLAPYDWNASQAWFAARAPAATFLVLSPAGQGESTVTYAEAIATFGNPVRTLRDGEYSILTWPSGRNLLAALTRP